MARIMGDAISSQASALPASIELVAGYDTGTADIRWTAATFARFPGLPHVHIDQGGPGAPVYSANVIDVETGAWSPANVPGWIARCTAPVPTVYCNRSTLPAVLATGWRGPVWLAFPGWNGQTSSLPALPAGCRYVAVQNDFQQLYDLSTVLDPSWPLEADMVTIPGVPGSWLSVQILSSADGSKQVAIGLGTDGALWQAVRSGGAWGTPVPV